MLENYKKSFYSISNKAPNPTNFSNSKSQRYLNDSDIENFPPSNIKHRLVYNLSCNKSYKCLLVDDTFGFSEHSVNDTMIPHTSKPVRSKPGRSKKLTFSPCKSMFLTLKAEKSTSWCPPENKGDTNTTVVSSFPEAQDKFPVSWARA
eukprot:TRINITY_DN11841_c0_g1_i1.p2 TRINITY_DN11841_c0_g1~~TRINITY_DN11841_c0_g1_i1.p2  ORF type:complete len:148 (-),score=29.30 TRINITY_DN11841_c0_g1_i1:584-1027(-)